MGAGAISPFEKWRSLSPFSYTSVRVNPQKPKNWLRNTKQYSKGPWQLTNVLAQQNESTNCSYHNCDRIWEKGPLRAKRVFLPFFKLSPFQGLKSSRLLTRFVGSLGLLLHRSVRSYRKASVPSSEPPKWGIKWRFSNAIDVAGHPAHTGNGRGSEFLASIAGWWKNIHTKVQVHSCYGSRDISVLNEYSGIARSGPFSQILCHIWGNIQLSGFVLSLPLVGPILPPSSWILPHIALPVVQ